MTEQAHEQLAVLSDGDGRAAYAVPLAVLEAHRATPEQRAVLREEMGDVEGFSMAPDAPIHLLTEEALAPFRLSDEQRAALGRPGAGAITDDDVHGHEQFIGVFGSSAPGGGPGAVYVRYGGVISAWWRYGWISAAGAGSSTNADADYHPPLH